MTENVFLALDNPSAIANDYLYGYREYMKNLSSFPTIHIGSGDELVCDDGSDECKRLFQRIRSESVKSMFHHENKTQEQPNMRTLSEKCGNINCEFPTVPTYENHNQSNQVNTDGNILTTATVLKHSKESTKSASNDILKSIGNDILHESEAKFSKHSKSEQVQKQKMQIPPGFPPKSVSNYTEQSLNAEKPAEDPKAAGNKSEIQTTTPFNCKDRLCPETKQTIAEQNPSSFSDSENEETDLNTKPVDLVRKSHSGYQSQVRNSAMLNWRQREPLRDKKLKDLSELRQARSSREEETTKPEHTLPNNAR